MKGEEINYSNNLKCCIDVRDANLGDKIDENINIVPSESKNEDNNNNNKTKKKKKMCTIDVRISPYAGQRKYSVNILIIRDGDNEHYLNIRSISRLFHGSKYDKGMITVKNVTAHLDQLTN